MANVVRNSNFYLQKHLQDKTKVKMRQGRNWLKVKCNLNTKHKVS
jgi:hypothetical protein